MSYRNKLKENLRQFAEHALACGWTEEETRAVVEAVQRDVRDAVIRGHCCHVEDILRRHAMPVMARKRREKEEMECRAGEDR